MPPSDNNFSLGHLLKMEKGREGEMALIGSAWRARTTFQ